MKKTILSLMLMVAFLPPFTASGQTYYDFALAEIAGLSSNSIIRAVNQTEAVAYYETATDNRLALIDLSLNVREIKLPRNIFVRDIRVSGTNIYFCGYKVNNQLMTSNEGIIAHVSYNDFGSSVVPLTYDVIDSNYVSVLYRLAAYYEPATQMDKIVAVGEHLYAPPATGCIGMSTPGPYICGQRAVLECDFDPNVPAFSNHTGVYTNVNVPHLEYVDEVIETDNYIAIVGFDKDEDAISIHPCPKGASILSSFDTYYYYPGTEYDGLSFFHGCVMRKDTIAIASLSLNTPTPTQLFETRIRTFDLPSHKMTTSQAVYLGTDKTEPLELVYMPHYQKLVMLMYFQFPPNQYNYTFLHLKPYSPVPYTAKGLYESGSRLPYTSVDRLTTTHYISTGGDYWFMKDVTIDAASTNCYKVDNVDINKVEIRQFVKKTFNYTPAIPGIDPKSDNLQVIVNNAFIRCIKQ